MDNRVEAPAWVPDGGSDSAASGQQSDGESASTTPEAPAAQTESDSVPAAGHEETVSLSVPDGHAAPAEPAQAADAGTREPGTREHSAVPNGGSQYGNGSSPPPPIFGPPNPAAAAVQAGAGGLGGATAPLATAADAARGLAAKVSAPFSGLSKPKSRPKPRPKTGPQRPAGPAAPPRPQSGVRPQARLTPGPVSGPQSRRAQLKLDRIEPWSVMKFSFLISLVGWVVLLIAVSLLYLTLSKLGVFTSIEHTVGLVTTSKSKPGSNAASWFKASRVLGYTMLVGAVNVILFTALATIGAVLYNLVTMLAGGIEVTLKESD